MDNDKPQPWPSELTFSGAILKDEPDEETFDGEPSTEATVEQLRALAEELSQQYLQEQTLQPEQFAITPEAVQSVANFIDRIAPFYNQGTGISTIPEQLKALEGYQHSTRLPGEEERARAELRLQLDCKLATVLCGMVLESLAAKAQQAVTVRLITYQNSHHPSLIVGRDETRIKIDFSTKDVNVPATLLEMDIPMPHRLSSASFAHSRVLSAEDAGKYEKAPYNVFDVGLEGLQVIDRNYLDS